MSLNHQSFQEYKRLYKAGFSMLCIDQLLHPDALSDKIHSFSARSNPRSRLAEEKLMFGLNYLIYKAYKYMRLS